MHITMKLQNEKTTKVKQEKTTNKKMTAVPIRKNNTEHTRQLFTIPTASIKISQSVQVSRLVHKRN